MIKLEFNRLHLETHWWKLHDILHKPANSIITVVLIGSVVIGEDVLHVEPYSCASYYSISTAGLFLQVLEVEKSTKSYFAVENFSVYLCNSSARLWEKGWEGMQIINKDDKASPYTSSACRWGKKRKRLDIVEDVKQRK